MQNKGYLWVAFVFYSTLWKEKFMPGKIRLSEVMRSLSVTITDDGYEMKSIAGKAFYGVTGLRGKVDGIPEYFPISLQVKNLRKQADPKKAPTNGSQNLDNQLAAQAAQISNPGSSITKLTSDLAETNASITQKSTSCVGAMTSLPFSVPASSVNELHIDSARINKGSISEAHICGNTIEQETLSGVLTNTLHNVNPKEAGDVAEQLAKAAKSAFSVLEHAPGEQDKEQPKEPDLSGRVSILEACLTNQGSQLAELRSAYARSR